MGLYIPEQEYSEKQLITLLFGVLRLLWDTKPQKIERLLNEAEVNFWNT